ncbi:hypothetical protein NPIL_350411 [Nephila pilipes]|uniref:Uncharacterized protein n=1 Tax=Nephila pilipes TaxID=299642 RepID=A0A8X6MBX4_NEPPI|nr:hypothetical protein NPIL_350411 [Nephila pilipes]
MLSHCPICLSVRLIDTLFLLFRIPERQESKPQEMEQISRTGEGKLKEGGRQVSEWRQDSGETGKSNAFLTSDRWMLQWEKTVCHMKTVIREWERRS